MRRSGEHGRIVKEFRRVGVIGDVHTERKKLQAVLDHFAGLQLDAILCTGDVPDGPYDASEVDACYRLLKAADAVTISGNHERWILDDEMRDLEGATHQEELAKETLEQLASLPPTMELATPRGAVLLCHGLGADDMTGVYPHDHGAALDGNDPLQAILKAKRYRYVINGHTHRPMVRDIEAITIINAGTLLEGQRPCCLVVDFEAGTVTIQDLAEDGSLGEVEVVQLSNLPI